MEPLDSLYRAAFEHAHDAVVAVDEHRRIRAANQAAAELFQCPRDELVGRLGTDFYLPGGDDDEAEKVWRTLFEGGSVQGEIRIVRRDGAPARVAVTAHGNIAPGVHLAILRDVTRRHERLLSSRRYELLREHAQDVVLFVDKHGRVIEANRAAEAAYGYTRDELLSLTVLDLRHPATAHDYEESFRRAFASGAFFETVHRRKDGTAFPVEVASRAARVGDDVVLLSVIRDRTDRMALQAKLLETDRLSMFGMMAAGIAHEINNPLAYVLANAEVLARTLPKLSAEARAAAAPSGSAVAGVVEGLSRCEAMLGVAMEGLERVRSIVRDLRTFSRSDPEGGALVDVHQVLDSSLNVAQSELRHRARIVRAYGEVPIVLGSTSRLGQVFLNLIVNGAQAIPEERGGAGEVRIATSTTPEGWANVEIRDDGVGIAPDAKRRLFEPFHTTKHGEGTGLGLYISRTIVERHGGRIEVESELGAGTTMRVLLPPYDPERTLAPEPTELAKAARRRVLVVDDEPAIGESFRAVLAPSYETATETSLDDALARLRRDDRFDAILCDVMMPGGSGVDLYDRVRAELPALADRFVLMTGGLLDAATRERVAASGLVCLEKPLSEAELVRAIEGVARGAGARGRVR